MQGHKFLRFLPADIFFALTSHGRALGVASLAGLTFVGFYDLSIEVQAGIHAAYLSENCGCENGR